MTLEEPGSVGTGRQPKSPCVTLARSACQLGREMPEDAVVVLWGKGRMWWAGGGKAAKELSVVAVVCGWGLTEVDLRCRRDSALL